jgi:hypothetical protein
VLKEKLHLEQARRSTGITNLRKNYTTFLGIKFKVVPKGNKWIIRSHIADKSKEKVTQKLKLAWKDVKDPAKQNEIDANITRYNSIVMGVHEYYCMATMVSADFAGNSLQSKGQAERHEPITINLCRLKKRERLRASH